jgi:hypothetical protein
VGCSSFGCDHDAPFGQEFLDIAEAEREAQIHPDGTLDDVTREAIAGVRKRGHAAQLRRRADHGKAAQRDKAPSRTAEREPTQRDRHLQLIAERGRMGWQKASGYNKRARAETAIGRWKRVIGDGLRSRTDERRATEMGVAVQVLNRMLELGRPNYVRIA